MASIRTGLAVVLEKVPLLRRPWIALGSLLGAWLVAVVLLRVSRQLERVYPPMTVLNEAVLLGLASGIFYLGFWRNRRLYRQRYGQLAYQYAFFRFLLPWMALMAVAFAYPFEVGTTPVLSGVACLVLASVLALFGLLLWTRALMSLGLDAGLGIYVYFPEEARLVSSAVYSYLRHPVYASAICFALAIGLWRGTFESLVCAGLMTSWVVLWSRVEDKELADRRGDGYQQYKTQTPAFIPHLAEIPQFLRCVLLG